MRVNAVCLFLSIPSFCPCCMPWTSMRQVDDFLLLLLLGSLRVMSRRKEEEWGGKAVWLPLPFAPDIRPPAPSLSLDLQGHSCSYSASHRKLHGSLGFHPKDYCKRSSFFICLFENIPSSPGWPLTAEDDPEISLFLHLPPKCLGFRGVGHQPS